MSTTKKSWWVLFFVAVGLMACGDGVLADGDDIVYFTPWNADRLQSKKVQDSMPVLSAEDEQNFTEVMRGFTQQAPEILENPGVVDILPAVEQGFVMSGNYLDIVELYRRQVDEYGTDTFAAPALAWAYIQLGNEPAAIELTEQLENEHPDDPVTWVVVGAYHLRNAEDSRSSAEKALESFERVLELDPDFEAFQAMTLDTMNHQIEALQSRLAEDDQEEIEATEEVEVVEEVEATEEEAAEEAAVESAEQSAEVVEEDATAIAQAQEAEVEEEAVAEEEADEEQAKENATEARASHHVTRGQQALQRGSDHSDEARQQFERALELEPENVDAGIGILRLAQRSEAPAEMLARQVDTLSAHELTAQQAYELGLFCLRSLNDPDRATSLLERVRQKDPSFARRVGVDSLLER